MEIEFEVDGQKQGKMIATPDGFTPQEVADVRRTVQTYGGFEFLYENAYGRTVVPPRAKMPLPDGPVRVRLL